MAEDAEQEWWSEGEGNLQGVPNSPAPTQQIFVTQGQGVPIPLSTSTGIILALVLSILGVVCCGPLAIVSLIIAQVKLSETKNLPGHPDHGLARATQIISIIALVLAFIQIVAMILTEF